MLAIIITSHLQKQHCLKPFILLMLLNKLSKATCVALTVRSGLLICFIAIMSKIKPVSPHYFNRFEFQGRGTLHMHLLVWLNNCKYKTTQTLQRHCHMWMMMPFITSLRHIFYYIVTKTYRMILTKIFLN